MKRGNIMNILSYEYFIIVWWFSYHHYNFKNGGQFGTAIVKEGEIISTAHNTVLESKDATAHAEINAIRQASKKLNTHDLSRMHIIHKC